ncbi:MAG TPA: 23S rRNA (adenine(2503)-C(2))-methyltransferase RlmN [Desulfobacterales bacterium]|nr:23S rRNA (adenine(2503)-C(2))-methyltransferase RlmN [Desulfobacterales bacterium]
MPDNSPNSPLTDLRNLTLKELTDFIVELGEPKFRARQIFSWLYRPQISSFSEMTNLALTFRARLQDIARLSSLQVDKRQEANDGTVKYAFKLADNALIESVLIPDDNRHTLCVSSQVGCAMGCAFCLTGTMGLRRNLTAAEIVNQVIHVRNELEAKTNGKGRINNLVFMGMGEPLANYDNLRRALDILTDDNGLDFSQRRITVSTCGLVPKIEQLGAETKVNLAISLHAADNETRSRLLPINQTYDIDALLQACRAYPLPKRRRIMIEYVLLAGINDRPGDARRLIKILHKLRCKINLLPCNETEALPFKRPERAVVEKFQHILQEAGYTAIIRESRGAEISAACGQLANKRPGNCHQTT